MTKENIVITDFVYYETICIIIVQIAYEKILIIIFYF